MKLITEKPNFKVNEELSIDNSNWDKPENLAVGQISMDRLFRTVALEPATEPYKLSKNNKIYDLNSLQFPDPLRRDKTLTADQFLNRRLFNDALLIMHKGTVIHETYRNGMEPEDRHVIHSCTKSLCAMVVSMAIDEGLMGRSQEISHYIPEFQNRPEWKSVTLQHVLDMQAGIEYSEDYTDPNAHYWKYARAAGYYPPLVGEEAIGAKAWIIKNLNIRQNQPGSIFSYNSCLANVLGMALENVYKLNLGEILEEKLYSRVGAESEGHLNTDPQGFPIIEGQFNLRLRDFARCAYPIINDGKSLSGEQLINPDFINQITTPNQQAKKAYQSDTKDSVFPNGQYHDQFWVVEPEKKQFTMLGIHGQFAWFDHNKDLMVVGLGSYPSQDGDLMMSCLKLLWDKIASSVSK